ncbi:MAG: glycerol-3-phosphate 1-O-acyltransferase PlsY [Bacteroidia bacterium]|nr:glycerol-3-phosphate 1-O-acyltransferase PlsY [Bacteroidia bacterium]MDW8158872.1 glycerol-3-phosphate 1-O-acyltransferase PlsY [Bacteroidia bacterium]
MTYALILLSYLLGSLVPAIWISKYFYGRDIRTLGSGNAGSTNMYRNFGFKAGLITQILDIAKGSIAASLPVLVLPNYNQLPPFFSYAPLVCGIAAIIGHVYPIFAKFRGGKGVNTVLGVMLVLQPIASIVGVIIFGIVLLLFRMVSLASISAVASFPIFLILHSLWQNSSLFTIYFAISLLLTGWIIFTHRSNILRIFKGTEPKIPSLFSKISKHSGKATFF